MTMYLTDNPPRTKKTADHLDDKKHYRRGTWRVRQKTKTIHLKNKPSRIKKTPDHLEDGEHQ